MYPARYLGLFPAFPLNDIAFVAMSFADEFKGRRENVIVPAIEAAGLQPLFADTRDISDSIITEIVEGIRSSRVIIGDVSVDQNGIRNANVMYEIGIAHAARQAEKVLLFRSDDERLLFDLANIRVNSYHPDDELDKARDLMESAIKSAIAEVNLTKNAVVREIVPQLDDSAIHFLIDVATKGPQPEFPHKTMDDSLSFSRRHTGMLRLLDFGCISRLSIALTKDGPLQYSITPLGRAVFRRLLTTSREGAGSDGAESASP